MKHLIFAANWKMHHGPTAAAAFMEGFLAGYRPAQEREVWFFPPAVSLATVRGRLEGQPGLALGVQNVHWEMKGAFTGEISVALARDAGATHVLVGHSERRHVFGETDEETGRKVRAALGGGLTPVLCVGEKLEEREAGDTVAVVERQLAVLGDLDADSMARVVIAYEPVWAIGTGKNATPDDAGSVHEAIRSFLAGMGRARRAAVLYGGSVKPDNARELVTHPEVDGVLVGGASLDAGHWLEIAHAGTD